MPNYRKTYFDPATLAGFARVPAEPVAAAAAAAAGNPALPSANAVALAPREDWAYHPAAAPAARAEVFVFMQEAVLALNVALATGRPLLVSGEPGGGKTSLALRAAAALGRRFYRQTITSRTQVTDLLSAFDAVARLGDAQRQVEKPTQAYLAPGALWWALSPATAAQRGLAPLPGMALLTDPDRSSHIDGALLLLDEIDKADPDIPNDLLEVLDERKFTIPETGEEIRQTRNKLLIVLTTNDERELPQAFLRRCVTLELPGPPHAAWLVDIARRRYPPTRESGQSKAAATAEAKAWAGLYARVADELMSRRAGARATGRRKPSTSEFLDAVRACRELAQGGALASDPDLQHLLDSVLVKDRATPSGR